MAHSAKLLSSGARLQGLQERECTTPARTGEAGLQVSGWRAPDVRDREGVHLYCRAPTLCQASPRVLCIQGIVSAPYNNPRVAPASTPIL